MAIIQALAAAITRRAGPTLQCSCARTITLFVMKREIVRMCFDQFFSSGVAVESG